jgi:DNA-binding transcriptional LysR family regulator
VTATAAGREVVTEARRTLRQAEGVTVAAERHRRGETGVLRVGFEASGAGELTTRARAEFARRHPGVPGIRRRRARTRGR